MEDEKYNAIMEYKCRGAHPLESKSRSVRVNFRPTCKLYDIVDGKVFRRDKEVLRADDLTEVNSVHGVLGLEHKWFAEIGGDTSSAIRLFGYSLKVAEAVRRSVMYATGTVWLLKSIRQFKPLDETAGREGLSKVGCSISGRAHRRIQCPL